MKPAEARLKEALALVYGQAGERLAEALVPGLRAFARAHPERGGPLDRLDLFAGEAMLISYPDQVTAPGAPALAVLRRFLAERADFFADLHLLPHYPYSSDDGFAVLDYYAVREGLGGWDEVARLARERRLMLDAVINHLSSKSVWFQRFLAGEPPFDRFFLTDPGGDTSRVVRPRTTPLFTEFAGRRVWTTFGPDQVDLDYRNPEVFRALLQVLLFYVEKGAEFLRLDAVGFLWKAPGRRCLNEPETHALVRAFRAALDLAAPRVKLVSETNVPHAENVAYFGDGTDEAQLVYNFALPPLVLHAYAREDARVLVDWAAGLKVPGPRTAFLNFLASHDGIGLRPVEGILPEHEVAFLVARSRAHGGEVGERAGPRGPLPYELNLTWWDALNPPGEDEAVGLRRHLGSHLVMLALEGLPAVYFHSLLGTPSWREGYRESGIKRRLNRQKFTRAELEAALAQPGHRFARVLAGMRELFTRVRPHPKAPARLLAAPPAVFAAERDGYRVYVNFGREPVALSEKGPPCFGQGPELPAYGFGVWRG